MAQSWGLIKSLEKERLNEIEKGIHPQYFACLESRNTKT